MLLGLCLWEGCVVTELSLSMPHPDPGLEKALQEYLTRLKRNFPDFVRFGEGDEALEVNERTYKLELVDLLKQNIESSLGQAAPAVVDTQAFATCP